MKQYDIVVIGGGPAGLAAALSAKREGIERVIILERENKLGGILNQCIHNGFGLYTFKEELTGPEYAQRFIDSIIEERITYKLNTMVLNVTKDKVITAVNEVEGVIEIQAKAVVFCMGCRERPRGIINIPAGRCSGIYTAGTVQRFVNIEGYMPGKEAVILGSGDIALIMARRMTLEGAKVKAVVEIMPYSSGLKRNIVQCLDEFNIPMLLNHTVIDVKGKDRLEGIVIAGVDDKRKPIKGTEEFIACDTLLLSVGLEPENELSRKADVRLSEATGGAEVNESLQTSIDGIFACGNVLHVHDLVDNVTTEGIRAGKNAADFVKGATFNFSKIEINAAEGIKYTVPKYINPDNIRDFLEVKFRVSDVFKDRHIAAYFDGEREVYISRKMLTPSEMESVVLSKEVLERNRDCKKVILKVE